MDKSKKDVFVVFLAMIIILSLNSLSLNIPLSGISISSIIAQVSSVDISAIMKQIEKLQIQLNTLKGTSDIKTDNSVTNNDPATFIKTYHLWDKTEGFGVTVLKNGGYLLTGDIISGAGVFYPFIIKTDTKGNALWSERSLSPSNVYSISSSRHIGRLAVETTDGNIVMVSDTSDFVSSKYEESREAYGDVLITKLDSKGSKVWSIMIGDYSTDQPQKLWALPDGEVMVLARFYPTGFGNNVADTSVLKKYSVLIKIDKNGQVQTSKKMDWDAININRLSDGSFIALANISIPKAEQPKVMGESATMGDLPTIIKLNSSLNVEWSKSIETISSEMNSPVGIVDGKLVMNVIKLRTSGGDFKAVEPTSDGGFMAFGYASFYTNQGMMGGSISSGQTEIYTDFRPIVAVKVDATGKYQWARKLTGSLYSATSAIDFHITKTTDNGFVILQEVSRDGNWKTYEGNGEALAKAWVSNIELIKTDADFNPIWIKKVDIEKDLSGYDLQSTPDGGVVATGMISTNKTHMVMGSEESYKEAVLIKVDVNGGLFGCVVSSDYPKVKVEDQSQYLIVQNMNMSSAVAKDAVLNINKKVSERVSVFSNISRNICEYQKNNATPISTHLNSNTFISPLSGQSVTPPVAKTWMQINFDNTKEAKIEAEKNRKIHNELLPGLNKIFNQVKIKDSENSGWMTYIFPRLVTRADVEAVQKYYEGLGYKIDESGNGTLNVSKIGLSLRMTFYINNTSKGELDVMF